MNGLAMLKDGRKIRAIISEGVLEVDVANPVVDPEKGRRFYRQHRGKMRTVLVKAIEPETREENRLSYEDLKANTAGYIEGAGGAAAIALSDWLHDPVGTEYRALQASGEFSPVGQTSGFGTKGRPSCEGLQAGEIAR